MIVHQAFLGEKDGSHGDLASSIHDSDLIKYLKINTDKPSSITVPYPYLSGSKFGDYYVFTKTMNDHSAERSGMVFSHCLIVPLAEISQGKNISTLWKYFVDSPDKEQTQLSHFEIDFKKEPETGNPKCLEAAVSNLLKESKTVIFLGYEDFESLISKIWELSPPSIREDFSFTIAGSPNDIVGEGFDMIHTDPEYSVRWTDYPKIEPNSTINDTSIAFQFYTNPQNKLIEPFTTFLKENGFQLNKIHQIPGLVSLFERWNKAQTGGDLISLKRVIIAINKYLPNTIVGKSFKAAVLKKFWDVLETSNHEELFILRNLSLDAFAGGQESLGRKFSEWINQNLVLVNGQSLDTLSNLIMSSFTSENPDWWKTPIQTKLRTLLRVLNEESAKTIWKLFSRSTELLTSLFPLIKTEKDLIQGMLEGQSFERWKKVSSLSRKKKWFQLFAISNSNHLSVSDGIKAQLNHDQSSGLKENLTFLSENYGAEKFVTTSLEFSNSSLVDVVSEICVGNENLLKLISLDSSFGQKVFVKILSVTKGSQLGNDFYRPMLYTLLDRLIGGQKIEHKLITLVLNIFSSLSTYGARERIWSHLDQKQLNLAIPSTCKDILENWSDYRSLKLEPVLLDFLKSSKFVQNEVIKAKLISVREKLTYLKDLRLRSRANISLLLTQSHTTLNHFEAEMIANWIKEKGWKDVLLVVYTRRNDRQNFNQIVTICKDMLSFWQEVWFTSNKRFISIPEITEDIDKGNLEQVFSLLQDLGVNDKKLNRLKDEYISGTKGIEFMDLNKRLKTYIRSLEE